MQPAPGTDIGVAVLTALPGIIGVVLAFLGLLIAAGYLLIRKGDVGVKNDLLINDLASKTAAATTGLADAVAANTRLTARVEILEEANAGLKKSNTEMAMEVGSLKTQQTTSDTACKSEIERLNAQIVGLTAQVLELKGLRTAEHIEAAGKDAEIGRLRKAAETTGPSLPAGVSEVKVEGELTLHPKEKP